MCFMFETTLEAGQVAELLDEGLPPAIHALLKHLFHRVLGLMWKYISMCKCGM